MKKRKGLTLIELLAVIIILSIILIIATPKIIKLIDQSQTRAFYRDEDILVEASKNYLSKNSELLPKNINDVVEIPYSKIRDNGYVEKIYDPKNKEACFDISKVLVRKLAANRYKYIPALACPNYFSLAGFNLLTNYVDFDSDIDGDGLADGFLFWSSKNDFTPALSNQIQALKYNATKKISLGISEIKPPTIGDKVYVSTMYKASRNIDLGNAFYLEFANIAIPVTATTEFKTYSAILDVVNESHKIFLLDSYANINDTIYIKNVILINLTEIYGAGNEPSKNAIDQMIERYTLY
jgi:general secretion pathway protein G